MMWNWGLAAAPISQSTYSLHLNSEPANLDPHLQKSSSAGYVLDNLYRNLFWLNAQGDFKPDLAEECHWSKQKKTQRPQWFCRLKANLKWSDGSPLTAKQFIQSYQRILDRQTMSRRADLLFPILNAENFFRGETDFSQVGIEAPDPRTLIFTLKSPQPEFQYAFVGFYTAPTPEGNFLGKVFSGPYLLQEWKKNEYIKLVTNKYYVTKKDELPEVKFFFVADDSVAVKMYQKSQIQFLRRLPTHLIPQYQKSKDFFSLPIFRFDYLGFGELLGENLELRKALALSLPYDELTQMFHSKGRFGCAGLPDRLFHGPAPCYKQDLSAAKTALKKSAWPQEKPLRFIFSSQGGEDHQRMATWMQIQWKKNLGLNIEIAPVEFKIFLTQLRQEKQFLFRRGVAPDRLSCSAALENFRVDDSENFLKHFHLGLDADVNSMPFLSKQAQKKLCTRWVQEMMDRYVMIPLGAFEFSILASPEFQGWELNALNQLDLSQLKKRTP